MVRYVMQGTSRATIVPVTFRFCDPHASNARQVSLLGPFNGWTRMAHPLTKTPEGDWAITINLCPGQVVYCFDVDGTPCLDPHDDGRIPNGSGSEYSVRTVSPIPASWKSVRSPRDPSNCVKAA
jgi:1,4-alpha-glucan branching enzyme